MQLAPLLHSNVSPLSLSTSAALPNTDSVSNLLVEQIGTLSEENESLNLVDHMRGNAPYPCHSEVVPHLQSNDPCHGLLGAMNMETIQEGLMENINNKNVKVAEMRRRNRLRAAEASAAEAMDISPVDEQLLLARES
jgi:hypothetical protein